MSFSASWGTKCANPDCGTGWVNEGELAHYIPGPVPLRNNLIEHVHCPPGERPAGIVCPQCFLEMPVSGVCGSCE